MFSVFNYLKPKLNHVFIYKCCYALYNIYICSTLDLGAAIFREKLNRIHSQMYIISK